MAGERTFISPAVADSGSSAQELFAKHYGTLLDSILESRRLFVPDAERLLTGLAGHLPEFSGSTDADFIAWADSVLGPAVERLSSWYAIRSQHEGAVFAGIWAVLKTAFDLCSDTPQATADALADETWSEIWEKEEPEELFGSANVSAWLYAKGYWTARTWKTDRLREKEKSSDLDLERIGQYQDGLDIVSFIEPEYADDPEYA